MNADLEKSVRVTSRNELIANVLKDYFTEGDAGKGKGKYTFISEFNYTKNVN